MSDDRGYVKTWRKIRDNWVWKKPFGFPGAWIDLVMRASWKDHIAVIQGNPVELKRGEMCVGLRTLGSEWGWSKNKARAFLDHLERDGMIKVSKQGHLPGRIPGRISICNYDRYNPFQDTERDANRDIGGTFKGHLGDIQGTEEEVKEGKEVEEWEGNRPVGSDLCGETDMLFSLFSNRYKGHPPVDRKKFGDRLGTHVAVNGSCEKAQKWIEDHALSADIKPWELFGDGDNGRGAVSQERMMEIIRKARGKKA